MNRAELLNQLRAMIEDESNAISEYRVLSRSVATDKRLSHLLYRISLDEKRHYNSLVKHYDKMRKEA